MFSHAEHRLKKNNVFVEKVLVINCCRRSGLMIGNTYGPGNGTIWLKDVNCNGNENALEDCDHNGWGSNSSCDHDNDVSVTCSANLANTIGKLKQEG